MNDFEFKELVDLYLDKEIDGDSMQRLMEAIAASQSRRREFNSACQLHHAMRVALGEEVAANEALNPLPLRRWQVLVAMAASFICGAFFLAPAFDQSDDVQPLSFELPDPLSHSSSDDLLEKLPKSMQHYLARMSGNEAQRSHSSLAARLHLAGLSPDLAPQDARLQAVEIRSQQVYLSWDEQFGGWQVHRNSSTFHLPVQPETCAIGDREKVFFSDFPRRGRFEDIAGRQKLSGSFQLDTWLLGWQDN